MLCLTKLTFVPLILQVKIQHPLTFYLWATSIFYYNIQKDRSIPLISQFNQYNVRTVHAQKGKEIMKVNMAAVFSIHSRHSHTHSEVRILIVRVAIQ